MGTPLPKFKPPLTLKKIFSNLTVPVTFGYPHILANPSTQAAIISSFSTFSFSQIPDFSNNHRCQYGTPKKIDKLTISTSCYFTQNSKRLREKTSLNFCKLTLCASVRRPLNHYSGNWEKRIQNIPGFTLLIIWGTRKFKTLI